MNTIFVTGIDTGVGKTIVSAIITEKLGCAYWKPIQTGNERDLHTVKELVSNPNSIFIPEVFRLKKPASPHIAAKEENCKINENDLCLPKSTLPILIEGAGGLMVPINYDGLIFLDMLKIWKAEVVIVSKNYLGSINHTLLTNKALSLENIPVKGIIFNGVSNPSSEEIIEKITKLPVLLRVNYEPKITPSIISEYAKKLIW